MSEDGDVFTESASPLTLTAVYNLLARHLFPKSPKKTSAAFRETKTK